MSEERRQVELRFGALVPTLRSQLYEQGVRIDTDAVEVVEHTQRDADAVTRLRVRGVLTEAEAERARQRVVRELLASLEEHAVVDAPSEAGR